MRTLTAGETKLYTLDRQTAVVRVRIQDADGDFVDFTNLEGRNFVESVRISEHVDQTMMEATIVFTREFYDLTLAPLVEGSKLNRADGNYEALIAPNREVTIEAAVLAEGESPNTDLWNVAGSSFRLLFHGDTLDWDMPDNGNEMASISVPCLDLAGRLQRSLIETGRRDDDTRYSPDNDELAEEVMQQILDDWAPGSVTLTTPASPGWVVNGSMDPSDDAAGEKWQPGIVSVWDALQQLANMIGWCVRYRYHAASADFRLEFYEPDRAKTVADMTLGPDQYYSAERFAVRTGNVYNKLIVEWVDEDGDIQTPVTVNDLASQGLYGVRTGIVGTGITIGLHTSTEVTTFANNLLDDVSSAEVDFAPICDFRYEIELHDLITFTANGRLFDTSRNFAVIGYVHAFEGGCATTHLSLHGVIVGRRNWEDVITGFRERLPDRVADAPVLTATATVRGARLNVTGGAGARVRETRVEWHLSTSTGFTPSSATLRAVTSATSHEISDLTQGTTYYAKARVLIRGKKPSAYAAEVNFTPSQVATTDLADDAVNGAKLIALNRGLFGDFATSGETVITSTVTLTADAYYENLTIGTGGVLNANGYRVFVMETLTLGDNARIHNDGGSGGNSTSQTGGTAGAASGAGTLAGGGAGVAGGNGGAVNGAGVAGGGGASVLNSLGGAAGSGGAGQTVSGAGGSGGAGGSISSAPTYALRQAWDGSKGIDFGAGAVTKIAAGARAGAGGGGGGSGVAVGGGGGGSGGSGGALVVCARKIKTTHATYGAWTGSISAKGGAGGNGFASAAGGDGGGGGGGGGGWVVLIHSWIDGVVTLVSGGNVNANGGAAGTNGGSATNGTAGSAGTVRIQGPRS